MNKISLAFLFLAITSITACNNKNKKDNAGQIAPKTLADSLENEVMDGHNAGMAKYGKLMSMQNEAQKLLDSISKLPAKAREAATPLTTKLDGLVKELKSAKEGMDKWMNEYNMDSAVNNIEQRIKYLAEEKIKVSEVKESILKSLQKADSLLKTKF